ncbi:eukaryotic translation initiation factor 2 subunit beta-like [Apium graveolens]|uniref:eukaryotic translation initiation factor 2 subunit beta-like n=1 Tax=Apium graveolens TaxID=4045 RepID=UPI003D7B5652
MAERVRPAEDGAVYASFDPSKMKKKKKKNVVIQDSPMDLSCDVEKETAAGGLDAKFGQETEEADYTYEELLARIHNHGGEKHKFVMKVAQVVVGPKKSVLVNFTDYCSTMHRQPDHVMAFLLNELGAKSGSIDGNQRLVAQGKYTPKNFEVVLRKYVTEYVVCTGCKGSNTNLVKENRVLFVRCEDCGSNRSVAVVKAGFQARVGSRRNEN